MAVQLTVPSLGESITEAVVGKWHKKVGESVKVDEPVVVLETDKVTVDVPAPSGGAIAAIARKEGDKVKVGEVLGTINPEGAGASAPAGSASAPAPAASAPAAASPVQAQAGGGEGRGVPATPVARKVAEERGVDVSAVPGSGTGGRVMKQDVLGYQGGNGAQPN